MSYRYCANCGEPCPAESKYCSKCGAAMSPVAAERVEAEHVEAEHAAATVTLAVGAAAYGGEQWHYFVRNERVGPLGSQRLHELCAARLIGPDTLVWHEGMADWAPILSTEFASYFAASPQEDSAPVNHTFAWWLAAMPVIAAVVQIVFSFVIGEGISSLWVAAAVVHFVLCAQDGKVLRQDGHRPPALGWALIVPVYLFIRAARLRRAPVHAIVWFLSVICAAVLYGAAADRTDAYFDYADDSPDRAVRIVQYGVLDDHPERTVGEAADSFFDYPEWSGFVSEDGQVYVNLEGDTSRAGRQVGVILQFVVNVERETFRVYALEIAGESQDEEMIEVFIDALYEPYIAPGEVVHIKWEFGAAG